jgi:hypothetical protein
MCNIVTSNDLKKFNSLEKHHETFLWNDLKIGTIFYPRYVPLEHEKLNVFLFYFYTL